MFLRNWLMMYESRCFTGVMDSFVFRLAGLQRYPLSNLAIVLYIPVYVFSRLRDSYVTDKAQRTSRETILLQSR